MTAATLSSVVGPLGADAQTPILTLDAITKRFTTELDVAERLVNLLGGSRRARTVHAVEDVDLAIGRGEVLGLVGESGCGKSTLGRVVAGVHDPTAGTVRFEGRDLHAPGAHADRLRVQMIFQDPMSSLNPRMRVRDIVGEAPRVHGLIGRGEERERLAALLAEVGLDASFLDRYPHQFSGGQRQRIGIARALALEPEVLVCDESIAALDVSIQAQVINLFMDLRERRDLTYLFISHDLGVVEHLSDRVAIMYLGRIVELAPVNEVFERPNHPYTRALLAEVPRLDRRDRSFHPVRGEIPSPLDPPPGCAFHPRCPHAHERCRIERPVLRSVAPRHASACHLNDEA